MILETSLQSNVFLEDTRAFCVKMLSAITSRAHVLVNVAGLFLVSEYPQIVLAAQLSQLAVNAAPPALAVAVQRQT